MICQPCAAAGDLGEAARSLYAARGRHTLDPFDRIQDAVGRPLVGNVIRKAQQRLHGKCKGHRSCTCQHRQQARRP